MRKLETNHWKDLKEMEGLLFFAQLVDEMLFDYTLDSYKPLALNSRLLCIECFETIEEVRNGYIPQKSLQSVVEELKWSLTRDLAAEHIFGSKYKLYIEKLKPTEVKLNELHNLVSFFYNSFRDRNYLENIIILLSNLIIEGKQKNKIKALSNSFISELINYGYNPNYIDYQNYHFFFNPTKREKIDSSDLIRDFFNLFDFEQKEFTVVFIGGIIFRNFKNTLNSFNIAVTKTYNCFSGLSDDKGFQKSRKQDESFIICSKIQAYDHHSARVKAESLIGQISGIFNFYHHKIKPEILDKTVVCRITDNYVVIIDKPTKSILKAKFDEHPADAAKSVENTLSNLYLTTESTHRFARSIDLHSAALTTNALENQLLDLWAALETLLPKSMESNKDRVVQICDSLIPFLQLNYLHKQLEQLLKDMIFWDKIKTYKVLNKLPNSKNQSDLEKIAAFISLEGSLDLRKEIYIELANYPLLKNRIYTLHETFKSTENIEKLLKMHEVKINWHLRRIYRVRGLIIHSGKYPSYTSILIENLHTYIDLFIKKIIDFSINKKIDTIEQVVFETQISLQFQLALLKKHNGEQLTIDNFREALLGENTSTNNL
jgi:hypothetical protein